MRWIASALLFGMAVVSCGSGPAATEPAPPSADTTELSSTTTTGFPPTTTVEGGVRILVTPGEPAQEGDTMAADLSGVIVEIGGCIYVREPDWGSLSLPWWPNGVTVEGDTIVVPDSPYLQAGEYRVGDYISAGGGGIGNSEKYPTRVEDAIADSLLVDQSTKDHALECFERVDVVNYMQEIQAPSS